MQAQVADNLHRTALEQARLSLEQVRWLQLVVRKAYDYYSSDLCRKSELTRLGNLGMKRESHDSHADGLLGTGLSMMTADAFTPRGVIGLLLGWTLWRVGAWGGLSMGYRDPRGVIMTSFAS